MQTIQSDKRLEVSSIQKEVLATLSYFSVFDYPVTIEELNNYLSHEVQPKDLSSLIKANLIQQSDNKYYNLSNYSINLEDRITGNKRAEKLKDRAIRRASFIGSFPFVRSVCLSGSMSKGYMGQDADLDFFIITKSGRLWIARTLLILYKKVFLLNSRKYFCVNYFLDTKNLEIEEKNRFTATEVVTLINVYGRTEFESFSASNSWAFAIFPKAKIKYFNGGKRTEIPKKMIEWLLNGRMGNKMDSFFMRISLNRWKKKYGHMVNADFEIAFKTRTYVSKHHPNNFQQKVLNRFESRYNAVQQKIKSA